MKYFLFFLIFSACFSANAQLPTYAYDRYYDCDQTTWQLDCAITLCSPGGSLEKAQEFIQSDFFKTHPYEKTLAESLLTLNLYGTQKSFELINKSVFTSEQKICAKAWVSYYGKNIDSYLDFKDSIQAKFPQNTLLIKLKLKDYMTTSAISFSREFESKIGPLSRSLDSITNAASTSAADKLFFRLANIDLKLMSRLSPKDYRIDYTPENAQEELIKLWNQYKTEFKADYFTGVISGCRTKECDAARAEARLMQPKVTLSPPEQAVTAILEINNKTTNSISPSEFEKKVTGILTSEKSPTEREKIKAIAVLLTQKKEISLGFLLQGMLKPAKFSDKFVSSLKPSATKLQLIQYLREILSKTGKATEITRSSIEFKTEMDRLQYRPIEDVQCAYGVAMFDLIYGKFLQAALSMNGYNNISARDFANTDAFINFLKNNPLYAKITEYNTDYLQLKNWQEWKDFDKKAEELCARYPNASGIRLSINNVMSGFRKDVDDNQTEDFNYAYLDNMIRLLATNSDFGVVKPYTMERLFQIDENDDYNHNNAANVFGNLTSEHKKALQDLLNSKIAERPKQQNLAKLKTRLDIRKGGKVYFESIIANAENGPLDQSSPLDISQFFDLNKSYMIDEMLELDTKLISKNEYFRLRKILPLLYYLKQKDEAVKIVGFLTQHWEDAKMFFYSIDVFQNLSYELKGTAFLDEIRKLRENNPKVEIIALNEIASESIYGNSTALPALIQNYSETKYNLFADNTVYLFNRLVERMKNANVDADIIEKFKSAFKHKNPGFAKQVN